MIVTVLLLTMLTTVFSKVLYLSPVNWPSHDMWNSFLASELAKRGHEVTFVTSVEFTNASHPNMNRIYYRQSERVKKWQKVILVDMMERRSLLSMRDKILYECEELLESDAYRGVMSSTDYDLVIIDYLGHDCLLGLSHVFQSSPFVLVTPLPYSPLSFYRVLGAPFFHALPSVHVSAKPPYSFWQRVESCFTYLVRDISYFFDFQPKMQSIVMRRFGKDALPLSELWKKVALLLTNTADWMNKYPVPPNIIPVGGIHLKEARSLNEHLTAFIDESKDGVILVSFGSGFPLELRLAKFRLMAEVFGRLSQRIIWKWDGGNDSKISFPKNIMTTPWIPQNDLLGHSKVRLFVSHCGGQSSLEAMYHGVPVLAMPGFWDQSENANRIVDQNAGVRLDFDDITQESFLESLTELLSNTMYRDGASKLKRIMRNQLTKPLDSALFWIEFVIRHKGAHHLRPVVWDLPRPYSLIVDLMVVIAVCTSAILVVSVGLLYLLCIARKTLSKSKRD